MDLARLIVSVDSSSVKAAANDLDKLTDKSKETTAAVDTLGSHSSQAGGRIGLLVRGVNQGTSTLGRFVSQVSSARVALAGLAGGAIVATARSFVMAADSMEKSRIRLENLTGSAAAARETQDYLYESAQRLNVGYGTLSDSYTKLLPLAQSNIITTQQARDILEGLGNVAAATGAQNEQLAQSMYGLSQGLSAGILRAEELNQIMEPLPGLLQKVDEAAGLPAGGFRKLVNEGLVTSNVLSEVLIAALDKYRGSAEQNNDLVSASLSDLGNAWDKLRATIGKPLVPVVSGVIKALTQLLELINTVLGGIGDVIKKAGDLITTVTSPDVAKIIGIGAAAGAGAVVGGVPGALIAGGIASVNASRSATVKKTDGEEKTVSEETQKQLREALAGITGDGDKKGKKSTFNFGEYLGNLRQEIDLLQMEQKTADILGESLDVYNQAKKAGIALNKEDAQTLATLLQKRQQLTEIRDIANTENDRLLNADLDKLTEVERKRRDILRQAEAARLEELLPLARELQNSGKVANAYDTLYDKIQKLRSVEITGGGLTVTVDSAIASAQKGLQDFAQVEGITKMIESAFSNAFKSMEDQLVEFVKTGKFSFSSLADSIISDLARIAIRQSITQPLASALGSVLPSIGQGIAGALGFGGGSTIASNDNYVTGGGASLGSLPKFASGGSFTVGGSGPTDSQVVAFRATPGERVSVQTPAQQQQESMNGSGRQTVAPVIHIDARGAQLGVADEIRRMIPEITQRVASSIQDDADRGGAAVRFTR